MTDSSVFDAMGSIVIAQALFEDGDNERLSLLGGDLLGAPDLREQNLKFSNQFHSFIFKKTGGSPSEPGFPRGSPQ